MVKMVKMVEIRGLMMYIKRMIPYGVVDCYRYIAIGLLAVLPLVSYSEARLMQPVEEVELEEIIPAWLEKPVSKVEVLPVERSIAKDAFAVRQSPPILPTKKETKIPQKHQVEVFQEQQPKGVFSINALIKAAQKGHVGAQYQLGMRYQYGDGVVLDLNEANRWLAKAALSGDAHSQHALSMFYQQYATNIEGTKKALLWEKKAADQGSADAQYALGVMFKNGRFVRKNEAEARKWLAMAAQQGHLPAQLVLQETSQY